MKYEHAIKTNDFAKCGPEGDRNDLHPIADNLGQFIAKRFTRGLLARFLRGWQVSAARQARPARLALISRIELGARQTVALVEAEGQHLLVATSPDGATSFFLLNSPVRGQGEDSVERFGITGHENVGLPARRIPAQDSRFRNRPARRMGESVRVSW
jgi:flagellar biosynthesis protein FliO